MFRYLFLFMLVSLPALSASPADTWTQTAQSAPGGGYYYQDQSSGEFCNPNFSCYAQYVVPSIAPPSTSCTEAAGQTCSGTTGLTDTDTASGQPGGGSSSSGGSTASAAGVTATNLSGFGPLIEIAKTLALICVPILLIAVGWTVIRNLRKGMKAAGDDPDDASKWSPDTIKRLSREDRKERWREMREQQQDEKLARWEERQAEKRGY